MNFRLTAILFGTVLILGLVLLGLALWDTDQGPPTDALLEELVKAGVKADQIDTVELQKADGSTLKLVKGEKDQWAITEPIRAKADSAAVSSIVNSLMRAKPTTYPELPSNPAVAGLDPPGLKVTLRQGSERSSTVNVGTITIGGSKAVAFVTTSARPSRPMAVPRSDVEPLFRTISGGVTATADLAKWTSDYRTKAIFSADARAGVEDVTSLKLTLPNKGNKELALSKSTGVWKFDAPANWGEADVAGELTGPPNTFSGVRPLVGALTNLQATGPEDFIAQPANLAEYGLNPDNPDLVRVEMKTKDGATDVVFIGKKVDPGPAPPGGAPPAAGKVYVRVEGQEGVIRASAANLDGLIPVINDPSPLRDRTLLSVSKSQIGGIDITAGGQQTRLRQLGGGFGMWQLFGGPNDPQDANTQVVNNLLDLLTERRTIKDFPPVNDANFAGPELKAEVKLWTEGTEPPDPKADPKTLAKAEPKMKGVPITLQFGKKDAAGVFVRRILANGTKNDFILPEKLKVPAGALTDTDVLATVVKNRLNFLDTRLKSFSSTGVAKLTIQNGPNVTEVVRDKAADLPYFPTGKWKFVKPDPQKDRVADEGTMSDLLNLLATQQATEFITETPTEPDLAKWKLTAGDPRLKVVVELDVPAPPMGSPPTPDADKLRVYYFGLDHDSATVYARQEGKQAVFIVPKFVYERFGTADLRDRTVLRFDKTKVTRIELQGWYQANKIKMTLKMERKAGTWTGELNGQNFLVDPAKIDQFLIAMEGGDGKGLRAKSFIPGPPTRPDFKFGIAPEPNQPAAPPETYQGFGINMEVEGGKKIEMVIGDLTDNGNSYFVWCGSLPLNEQVVTIQSDPFKPFKEKPGFFGK